jgi:hypothetical protein
MRRTRTRFSAAVSLPSARLFLKTSPVGRASHFTARLITGFNSWRLLAVENTRRISIRIPSGVWIVVNWPSFNAFFDSSQPRPEEPHDFGIKFFVKRRSVEPRTTGAKRWRLAGQARIARWQKVVMPRVGDYVVFG